MRTIYRDNYEPQLGDYHERIIIDGADNRHWLFDCDGVFTDITTGGIVENEFGNHADRAISQAFFTNTIYDLESSIAGEAAARIAADTDINAAIDILDSRVTSVAFDVADIQALIPNQASPTNQLADKDFVNSSVATNTANYISDNGQPFSSLADLEAYSGPLTNNDYAFVVGTDPAGNTTYTRYKYVASTSSWSEEYVLNNSSFTANQWAAINSGITSGGVTKLTGLADIQTIGTGLTLVNGELSSTSTGPTVVQTRGTSTTDVMSQNATTSMVFGDPSTRRRMKIGENISNAADYSIVIGFSGGITNPSYTNSISLGGGEVNAKGEVGIGFSGTNTSGYNNSSYRLLTGLYDPQSAHDAATKGYVDAAVAGAGITELTSADYDFPDANPTRVALWRLPSGIYTAKDNVLIAPSIQKFYNYGGTFLVAQTGNTVGSNTLVLSNWSGTGSQDTKLQYDFTWNDGSPWPGYSDISFVTSRQVTDNLTSTSTKNVLSANQGRILKSQIGDLTALDTTAQTDLVSAINEVAGQSGGGVTELTSADYNYPTANPNGIALWLLDPGTYVGGPNIQLYSSTSRYWSNLGRWQATVEHGTINNVEMVFGTVGSTLYSFSYAVEATGYDSYQRLVPDLVQATGTGTSNVMSQNAVSQALYSSRYGGYTGIVRIIPNSTIGQFGTGVINAVGIGVNAQVGANSGTAVGPNASTTGEAAIALGSGATASTKGQFDVSTGTSTTGGYNNSNYRLLTGLYDPQSDHDAATKGYVDTVTPTITMTTTDPGEGATLAANTFIGVYE